MLNLAEPLIVISSSGTGRDPAFLAEVGHSSLTTGHAGHQVALEVRLSVLGRGLAVRSTRRAAGEQVADLTKLWGQAGSELVERASAAPWWDRVGLVEVGLLAQPSRGAGMTRLLAGAQELLLQRRIWASCVSLNT